MMGPPDRQPVRLPDVESNHADLQSVSSRNYSRELLTDRPRKTCRAPKKTVTCAWPVAPARSEGRVSASAGADRGQDTDGPESRGSDESPERRRAAAGGED